MSDAWINWRFGSYHLQVGPWYVRFKQNPYWAANKPDKWFQRYD